MEAVALHTARNRDLIIGLWTLGERWKDLLIDVVFILWDVEKEMRGNNGCIKYYNSQQKVSCKYLRDDVWGDSSVFIQKIVEERKMVVRKKYLLFF